MSKSIWFDASWREKHDGAWIIPLSFLVLKLFAKKTVNLKIAIFFSLTRPGGVRIWPKEVKSGTIRLSTSEGFVWLLSHSSISIRGEMAWGVATPMCVLGWGNSMWGRVKRNCSPSENMCFLISFKWDFGLNWSECKIITNYKYVLF